MTLAAFLVEKVLTAGGVEMALIIVFLGSLLPNGRWNCSGYTVMSVLFADQQDWFHLSLPAVSTDPVLVLMAVLQDGMVVYSGSVVLRIDVAGFVYLYRRSPRNHNFRLKCG